MPREKPVIFVSHATEDAELARRLKETIETCFAKGVEVFATSDPMVLSAGDPWLKRIEESLQKAEAFIALITPNSIHKHWLWFEIGAFWARQTEGKGRILPLCAREVEPGDVPSPVSELQVVSLGDSERVCRFFETLCETIGFGSLSDSDIDGFLSSVPAYAEKKEKVASTPFNGHVLSATSHLVEYNDTEFEAILWKEYVEPEWSYHEYIIGRGLDDHETLFSGKLIYYRKVDEAQNLPPGTSCRLLKGVLRRYGYTAVIDENNVACFCLDGGAARASEDNGDDLPF